MQFAFALRDYHCCGSITDDIRNDAGHVQDPVDAGVQADHKSALDKNSEQEAGNNLHDRSVQLFNEAGISPDIALFLPQLATAYRMAADGFGATLTCDRLVGSPEDPLLFYCLDSPVTARQFYFLLPNTDYTPRAVREFIRLFREDAG